MHKILIRFISLILVPCLIADPALAALQAMQTGHFEQRIDLQALETTFATQVLAGVVVSETNPSVSRRDKLTVIASLFLFIQACGSGQHAKPKTPLPPTPPGLLMTSAQDLAHPLSEELKKQLLERLEPKLKRYDHLYFQNALRLHKNPVTSKPENPDLTRLRNEVLGMIQLFIWHDEKQSLERLKNWANDHKLFLPPDIEPKHDPKPSDPDTPSSSPNTETSWLSILLSGLGFTLAAVKGKNGKAEDQPPAAMTKASDIDDPKPAHGLPSRRSYRVISEQWNNVKRNILIDESVNSNLKGLYDVLREFSYAWTDAQGQQHFLDDSDHPVRQRYGEAGVEAAWVALERATDKERSLLRQEMIAHEELHQELTDRRYAGLFRHFEQCLLYFTEASTLIASSSVHPLFLASWSAYGRPRALVVPEEPMPFDPQRLVRWSLEEIYVQVAMRGLDVIITELCSAWPPLSDLSRAITAAIQEALRVYKALGGGQSTTQEAIVPAAKARRWRTAKEIASIRSPREALLYAGSLFTEITILALGEVLPDRIVPIGENGELIPEFMAIREKKGYSVPGVWDSFELRYLKTWMDETLATDHPTPDRGGNQHLKAVDELDRAS